MIEPDHVESIESFDGTRLQVQVFGEGPPILLANGIGVRYHGLEYQVQALRQEYRVIGWDYRGMWDSGPPVSGRVDITAQARDAFAILNALQVDRPALLGWSMGVQVAFEMVRLEGSVFARMAAIGGVPGLPGRSHPHLRRLHVLMPPAMDTGARVLPLASGFIRWVVEQPLFFPAISHTTFVRPHADREAFLSMARGVAHHDTALYLRTLAGLFRHDATEAVDAVDFPVLFLVGSRDSLIYHRDQRRLAWRMPTGRYVSFPGCSHFMTIEQPEAVNRALLDFFGQGLDPSGGDWR